MRRIVQSFPVACWATLIIALPYLLFALSKWYAIPLHDGVPIGQTDPDTWLRLTLVRDWLQGGSWYDHAVTHSNAPWGGSTSPWTRPLDLVIAGLASLQSESIDVSLRLMRASLLLPVLWMTLLVIGIHRAIRAVIPLPSAYVMASILVITSPPVWNYFSLGNADHHGPLAVLFVWAMGGVLTENPSRRLMLFTGVLLGLQLWISVEALMLIALVYVWYGIGWLRGDAAKALNLTWLATAAAITALMAILIERPPTARLTPIYDSISIAQVYALSCAAMLAWALRIVPTPSLRSRLKLALLGGLGLLGAIAMTYPKLLLGPMVGVDPFIISDFLPNISEAKPYYKVPASLVVATLIVPLLGLALCATSILSKRHAFYGRSEAATLGFFLLSTLVLYLCQQRWSYYLLPLAIVSVAPLLGALLTPEHGHARVRWPARMLLNLPPKEQARRRMPLVLGVILLPFAFLVGGTPPELSSLEAKQLDATRYEALRQTAQRDGCYKMARTLIRSGELVRVMPQTPAILLTPTDLGTEIMFFTPYRIVASNYHREGAAIAYVWGAEKITDEALLREHLKQREVSALLLCPKVAPTKDSLLHAYVDGKPLPSWLSRIPYTLPVVRQTDSEKTDEPALPLVKPLLLRVNGT